MNRFRQICFAFTLIISASPADAYPEFEVWVEENSGRYIDCAMCHTHPDGPEGVKPGQIRSLSPEQLDRLNLARSAFEPGGAVDSPILNDFGDRIVEKLGKTRFLEIRSTDPSLLVDEYGFESDIDGDGIPDVREYAEGTLPVDPHHGDPWSLFRTNLARNWLDIVMLVIATIAGLYGLNHLLRWFEHMAERRAEALEPTSEVSRGYLSRDAGRRRAR